MNRQLIILILVNIFFLKFSFAQLNASEKKVNKNKISKQITAYVEEHYKGKPVKYYILKTDKDSILYEAKVKSDRKKINLTFNEKGEFVAIDSEVPFREVSENIKKLINTYLSENYTNYKIIHCRDLKMGNQQIYQLDVSVKKKKYRFKFKNDGTLIDYKELPLKTISLLFN